MRTRVLLDRIGAAVDTVTDAAAAIRSTTLALATSDPTPTRAAVDGAVARALTFLDRAQTADGSFRDFNLRPGASTGWITAHVGFVLENVAGAERIRSRAAQYLGSRGRIDGGWSYNARVGVDCDSTAQAIMVVQCANIDVPRFAVEWLARCQLAEGSFPTYPARAGRRGWSAGHGDVTLLVCEALRRMELHTDAIRRTNQWLDHVTVDGVVPAYWWVDDAYSLWAQERTGFAVERTRQVAKTRLKNASLTSWSMLLASAAAALDRGTVVAPVTRLLGTQLEDGSWPCDPCLRVPNPTALTGPVTGPAHAGRRRVFSTAHATAALAAVSHLL